jgi:Mg/Co/Ni transporter MgtE
MKARDVMVSPVITVKPSTSVQELAETLVKQRISAVPVVDDQGNLAGIVSEGDLLHRAEARTERRHSWWLTGLIGGETLASEYIKAHSRSVADVMTRRVIAAAPDAAEPISFKHWRATGKDWKFQSPTPPFVRRSWRS